MGVLRSSSRCRHRRHDRRWPALAALTAAALLAPPASAQIFQLEAGSSSLSRADGGSLHFQGDWLDGWVGVGLRDPVRLGGALRARGRNLDLSFGDDVVPLRLPTDLFDAGHALYTRGVGVGFRRGATRVRLVGGLTSTVYSTPYYSAARTDDPIGMVQLESTVASNLTVSLRNLVYRRQTHLLGLDWSPPGPVRAALTAGTGAGEPYAAASVAYDRDWLSVKAAWARAGDSFHRVLTRQAQGSEVDRENVAVTIRPSRSATFVLGRNHYLQPLTPG